MRYRSFIAVEIPADIRQAILFQTASLRKDFPKPMVRWVESQNLHLTLKFLGDVSPEQLEGLKASLKVELLHQGPFDMPVGGLGTFPNPRQPRIIWIRLEALNELTKLQRSIENVAARIGHQPEERPFSPHLTIGRIGQAVIPADRLNIGSVIEKTSLGNIGLVRVQKVSIFKSDLHPGGPVYTLLDSLAFQPEG